MLATTNGTFFLHHPPSAECRQIEPHDADACGEFLPVRLGFEPDQDGPYKAVRWLYDWDDVFARLAAGERMFSIIEDYAQR